MNSLDELRAVGGGQLATTLYQRQSGGWTKLVRIAFLIVIGIVAAISIAGLAPHYNVLQGKCADLKPDLSVGFCATYIFGWELFFGVGFLVVATLLCWYKADTFVALLLAGTMVAITTIGPGMANALIRVPSTPFVVKEFVYTMGALASTGTVLLFYLLPDGRFLPGWTRILASIWIALNIIFHERIYRGSLGPAGNYLSNEHRYDRGDRCR